MRLFWKQFARTICLVMLVFAVFGGILLYSSFEMWLKEEKSRITQDISIMQYAVCSAVSGLPEDYEAVDYAVAQIGESLVKSRGDEQAVVQLYRRDGNQIYSSNSAFQGTLSIENVKMNHVTYEIVKMKDKYFLQSLSRLDSSRGIYYLGIGRDIGYIYVNRKEMYNRYCLILAGAIVVSAILSLIFTAGYIRPIIRLSRQTRRFASGNYDSRMQVRGNDEMAMLMEDFNEMADRLVENMRTLEDYAKSQEEFTAAFAHELKTPLTSIVGYADMLRMMTLSEEDVRMCGDYIFRQGSRLEGLSYKMLELVGIGKQRTQWKPISVPQLCRRAAEMLEVAIRRKNICLDMRVQKGKIWGDEDLLLSLLSNVMDNSRKACEDGGRICVKGIDEGETYLISISDNGRGIPGKDLDKIKEAFYMVDKSRARKEGGAGIGMALCEKIVRLHGGSWQIESTLKEGTSVSICLPMKGQAVQEETAWEDMPVGDEALDMQEEEDDDEQGTTDIAHYGGHFRDSGRSRAGVFSS